MSKAYDVAENVLKLLPYIHEKFLRPLENISRSKWSKIQFYAVSMLYKKGSLKMTELATMLQISKQQLTPLVDRLIEQGTVIRKSDDEDRRTVYIELTEDGRVMVEALWEETRHSLASKLSALDEHDLSELDQNTVRIREILAKIE